ncbi:Competence protein F, phosphoribosyltransferase domain [Serinicoccus hydrothermalis]|uniref:Competence protein F, phosphoribosyltransferase domain n=1 Tax=Serinicoccus hydrothermalis TaxID=1758689 RepID=A0A1B1NAD9_9MICO|nr:phosphoribosyltransferase family protein [Serinicoccus hydrothermalis]ANS78412.1 Competence protein F, phosphoribosyltransferase domain [Serinicoccus hydrothermalis]
MPWRPGADLSALLDLLAPSACAGCGAPASSWCAVCAAQLGAGPRPWRPTPCPPGFPPTWTGPDYSGVVRAGLVAWKEHDRVGLTAALAAVVGRALSAAVSASDEHRSAVEAGRPVAVLPAPSARRSTRVRGRSPVLDLARAAVGPGAVVPGLVLGRPVRDQAGLSAADRAGNLAGALALGPRAAARLAGVPCVVVDDIVTTGATLTECARVLRAAGAGPVVAATVAATSRHRADGEAAPRPLP